MRGFLRLVPGLPIPPEACTKGIPREGKKRIQPARFRPGFFPSLPGWTQGLAHSRNHGGGRFLVSEHKSLSHSTSDDGARELSCNDSLTGSGVTSKGVRFSYPLRGLTVCGADSGFFVRETSMNRMFSMAAYAYRVLSMFRSPYARFPIEIPLSYTSMKSLWAQEHIPDIHLLITSTRIHRSDKHPFPGSCA